MIKKIYLKNLRNSEILQFLMAIITRCKRFDIAALLLLKKVTNLEIETAKLDAVYNQKTGSDVTDLLNEVDKKRDKAITGMKVTCEGLVNHFNEAKASAAELILNSIERHGPSIAKLNYQAETTEINAILGEWKASRELTAALATLDMSSWAEELKKQNKLFSEATQSRIDDKLAHEGASFSELKPTAFEKYDKLSKVILAHVELSEKPEDYQKLIDGINLIIDEYNLILSRREGRNDEDEPNDDA